MEDCEIEENGRWQHIGIGAALARTRTVFLRCPECKERVSAHKAGTTGQRAHFEHRRGQTHITCSLKVKA
jgi:hypothetical protein